MSTADARRRLFWRMVSGSLWRRRERVMIALSAVAIGISVGAGLLLVSRDVERMVSRELVVYGPNLLVQPRGDEAATGMRDVRVGAIRTRDTFPLPAPGWAADASTPAGPVRAETTLPLLYGSARASLPMRWETVVVAGTDLLELSKLYGGWSLSSQTGVTDFGTWMKVMSGSRADNGRPQTGARRPSPVSRAKGAVGPRAVAIPRRDSGEPSSVAPTAEILPGDEITPGDEVMPGDEVTPQPPARVSLFVGVDAAKRIGVQPGDTLSVLALAPGGQSLPAKVIGVFSSGASEDAIVYLPRADAERLLGVSGRASVVLVRAVGEPRAIEAALAAGWLSSSDRQATALRRLTGAARELLGRLRALLTAVTIFALVTASLCTMSTLTDLVLERRREIALLKSLGARQRDVVLLFLAEAATLGLAGGLAGFVIGAIAAQIVGASVFHTAIRLDFRVLPAALALALAVTVVSSLPPVRYALALDPARALRGD